MIEAPYSLRNVRSLATLGHLESIGLTLNPAPVKFVFDTPFKIGPFDLGMLAQALIKGDEDMAILAMSRRGKGFSSHPGHNFIVLKREHLQAEMHELTHAWQNQTNPEFNKIGNRILADRKLTEKHLINFLVTEGMAEWVSISLGLQIGDTEAQKRLEFLNRKISDRLQSAKEVVGAFSGEYPESEIRLLHFNEAVKCLGYDAYATGLAFTDRIMRQHILNGASVPEGLSDIMKNYPDNMKELIPQLEVKLDLITWAQAT